MDFMTAMVLIAIAFGVGYATGRMGQGAAPPAPPDRKALEAVRPILEAEGKIAAIKAYREKTGAGLRDAKHAVDSLDSQS
jgi:ribosomal protein L7/L12